jgi:NAD(P)-dependent dehydrogenase (short-subunit alcohol dehydrogenase family)
MKTALVTGATDGVGRVVATRLAAQGWRVLAHGRNPERGEQLARETGATFLKADLSSLAEGRRLAELVKTLTGELQLLINNAGIGSVGDRPGRHESADGHELRFAVNYLAGFQLTHLLLPLLEAGAPARIVNVSSAGQQAIDFDDVMLTRGYSGVRAYCQSKLAQILFTVDLAEELAGCGIIANCLHPSTYMNTTMVRQSGTHADQQRRDRRRCHHAARGLAQDRRQERSLFQRDERKPRQSAGLRRQGPHAIAQAQPRVDPD